MKFNNCPLICEIRIPGEKTKRVVTTWAWYYNYGWPYVKSILTF